MIPRTLFSDEHEIYRSSVRRFIEKEIVPYHPQWEKDGHTPDEAWLKAGEAGLLCCTVPEEYGGPGADFLYSVIVIEELARAGTTGPGFYSHSDIAGPYILDFGPEEMKQKWLPLMASGAVRCALGMTEPSAGSDLAAIRTTAVRDGDDYVINGQKVFISSGNTAGIVITACKTDPKAGAKGISLILVEADRPGFKRGRHLEKIGWKAQDTAELFYEDVRVPVTNLIGQENRGFYHMMSELPQERLVQAVRAVAVAETALEWTIDYTTQRQAFGQTIADFQNTQFKLAEMKTEIVMQRVFIDRCIALHLEKKLDSVDAAMAKLASTELQGRVVDQCLQFFGGYGFMWEYPIARAFVDARVSRIAAGSVEIMKQIIARSILPKNKRT